MYCSRETLISKLIHLVIYGGRHLISMEGCIFTLVKTMGDVVDSTLMHINDLPIPINK